MLSMMTMVKDILQGVQTAYYAFAGNNMNLLLFYASFFYLVVCKKNSAVERRKIGFIIHYVLLFVCIFVCPITAGMIIKYSGSVYWRLLWLLLVPMVIAYAVTRGIFEVEEKWKRVCIGVFAIAIIALTGTKVYNDTNFVKADNYYKLSQDILVTCDAIEEDAAANAIEEKRAIVPNELVTQMRQYDAAICIPYGRDALRGKKVGKVATNIYQTMNAATMDAQALAFYAKQGNYQYLVYGANADMVFVFLAAGYEFVADVGNYYIYRLNMDDVSDILITQYGQENGNQCIFYSIQTADGKLVIIDGGCSVDVAYVRTVIASLGNHIDAWILTHPHEDHIGAFCSIYEDPQEVRIDSIYTVDMASPELCLENASWDGVDTYNCFLNLQIPDLQYVAAGEELDIAGLKVKVLSAYDDYVDELSNDLQNDGSMMFKVYGEKESMLFCADVGVQLSDWILEHYGDDIKSDYVQMGHHGNGGLNEGFYRRTEAKIAFFDAPDWLMEDADGVYTTPQNKALMEKIGATIYSFAGTPHSIQLH